MADGGENLETRQLQFMPRITSKYVTCGTEGCVFKPAFPNLADPTTANWVKYPNNITKLYITKEQYNKAITNTEKITGLLHNDAHMVFPYIYQGYHKGNIPKNMPASKRSMITDGPLYPLRMKNLGVSIKDAINNQNTINYLRTLPFKTILEQINKIYNQIKILFESGYIHGDVRETNIMIDSSGNITLIDFGWLYPIDEFFEKYKPYLSFYSNPPESLLVVDDSLHQILRPDVNPKVIPSQIPKVYKWDGRVIDPPDGFNPLTIQRSIRKTTTYIKQSTHFPQVDQTLYDIQGALIDTAVNLKNHIKISHPRNFVDEYKQFYMLMAPSFDSYGLSFTIFLLIANVYKNINKLRNGAQEYTPDEKEKIRVAYNRVVNEIIIPCLNLRVFKRLNIQEACARLQIIVDEYNGAPVHEEGAASGATAGGRRKTHKRRRGGKKTLRRK